MNKLYIGIDPGKSGGIAIIYHDNLYCIKCPATVHDMVEEIQIPLDMMDVPRSKAVIEFVHSMPGQGVKSMFTFGQNYGTWLGILAALKIPYDIVAPGKWMKHFGSMPKDKKDRKNKLKQLAQQAYPDQRVTLATADAILMAIYARDKDSEG
tara:strand:+ start:2806 stop:3261 length:456 start_codon:yes stop_codon:yes gene_type:complete